MASIVDLVVARIRARILQYVVNNQEKELQWRLWLLYCLGNSQDLRDHNLLGFPSVLTRVFLD